MTHRPWIDQDDVLAPKQAKTDYPALWEEVRRVVGLDQDWDVAVVVSLVVNTCPHCYANGRGCQCANDE